MAASISRDALISSDGPPARARMRPRDGLHAAGGEPGRLPQAAGERAETQFGGHEGGVDDVHVDALGAEAERGGLAEGRERRLGGRVGARAG